TTRSRQLDKSSHVGNGIDWFIRGRALRKAHPVERNCRLPAGDQIRCDPRRTVTHGPSHVTKAGIVPQVLNSSAAENRRTLWSHGSQTCPIFASRPVGAIGEEIAQCREHVAEILRPMRSSVA